MASYNSIRIHTILIGWPRAVQKCNKKLLFIASGVKGTHIWPFRRRNRARMTVTSQQL